MKKTPIQELLEEFNELQIVAPTMRDQIYLDGVLSVISGYEQKEKAFAFDFYRAGLNYGNATCMKPMDELYDVKEPNFDEFYGQYAEKHTP